MTAPFVPHCGRCGQTMQHCACPKQSSAPAAQSSRFVQRQGYLVCTVCGLIDTYCRGHADAAPAGVPAADGEQSRLSEVLRTRRGGR